MKQKNKWKRGDGESPSLRRLQEKVCTTWTGACRPGATPSVPDTYIRRDEAFKPQTKDDEEMEDLMERLKSAGMGGMNVYNRDEISEMAAAGEL